MRPANLPSSDFIFFGNLVATGWWGTSGGVLMKATVPFVPFQTCQQVVGDGIGDGNMCAGYNSAGCQGGSGGGLSEIKKNL